MTIRSQRRAAPRRAYGTPAAPPRAYAAQEGRCP
jgi:hypothetical protein